MSLSQTGDGRAIDAVCRCRQRIIGRLKRVPLPEELRCVRRSRQRRGAYPPTAAMKRFATALAGRAFKPPPGYKTSISMAGKFLSDHAPKKRRVKRWEARPNRQAGHSCYVQRSGSGKASSFPTRPRPTRLHIAASLTRTRHEGAAERSQTGYKPARSFHLNRRRGRRDLGNASLMPSRATPALPNLQVHHSNFPGGYGNKKSL